MTATRAPRPTDLVALVTFDEEVRENLAITRDHLGVPNEAPRPLAAAIEQWLHLGRRMWISMGGREIRGIATVRELSRTAWEIDTLVDAADASDDVLADLLRQAGRAAAEARVTRVLLRTPVDSRAARTAPRAGFRHVVEETLWMGNMPDMYNLVVNTNHELTNEILTTKTEKKRVRLIQQALDLAKLSQNLLKGEAMTQFIKRSVDLIK